MARNSEPEQVQVNFRMPADLKARIEAAAKVNNRTTTSELVATLQEKYPAPKVRGSGHALTLLARAEVARRRFNQATDDVERANFQAAYDAAMRDLREFLADIATED